VFDGHINKVISREIRTEGHAANKQEQLFLSSISKQLHSVTTHPL